MFEAAHLDILIAITLLVIFGFAYRYLVASAPTMATQADRLVVAMIFTISAYGSTMASVAVLDLRMSFMVLLMISLVSLIHLVKEAFLYNLNAKPESEAEVI
jgi:hypothetical protein